MLPLRTGTSYSQPALLKRLSSTSERLSALTGIQSTGIPTVPTGNLPTPHEALVPTGSPPVWVAGHVQFQCQTRHPFSTWGGGVSCCEPFLPACKHPWFLPDEKENEDIPPQRGPFPTPVTCCAQSLSHARCGQALPAPHVKAPDKVAGDLGAQWTGRQSGLCCSACDQRASNTASSCFLGSLDTRAYTSPQSPHLTGAHLINLLLNRFSCLGNGPSPSSLISWEPQVILSHPTPSCLMSRACTTFKMCLERSHLSRTPLPLPASSPKSRNRPAPNSPAAQGRT